MIIYFLVLLNFIFNTYVFGIHDSMEIGSILTIIVFIGSILFYRKCQIEYKDSLVVAVLLIIVMIIAQASRNLLDGMDISTILLRMQPFYVFFYFLPLIAVLNTRKRIASFVNLVKVSAVISALFSIILYVTQIGTSGTTGKFVDGYFRVYNPDAYLMAVCIFIFISEMFLKGIRAKMKLVFSIILILGILTTLHRNLMGATIIGILIIATAFFLTEKGKNNQKLVKFFVAILVLLFFSIMTAGYVGISSEAITERVSTGVADLMNVEGNFALRIILVLTQFQDVWHDSPIFGRGFDFIPLSLDNYLKFEPFSIVADADYGNLAIIFGFSIFLILFYLYYHLQKRAIYIFKNSDDLLAKSIALASIPLPLFFIAIGLFAPTSSEPPILNPLITMIALVVVINNVNGNNISLMNR